jgi:uncharacterized damage-inducible protein DinB
MSSKPIISKSELLQHWLAHRTLTRKTIEKFPEKELFEFSIGGMRTFADLVKEMLAIAVPGLKGIVTREAEPYNHNQQLQTKEALLQQWDADTPKITEYFEQISEDQFHDKYKLFGQYELTIINHILYFIDNEIHHRAQGFVYLRALGIEPPFFWDRY